MDMVLATGISRRGFSGSSFTADVDSVRNGDGARTEATPRGSGGVRGDPPSVRGEAWRDPECVRGLPVGVSDTCVLANTDGTSGPDSIAMSTPPKLATLPAEDRPWRSDTESAVAGRDEGSNGGNARRPRYCPGG